MTLTETLGSADKPATDTRSQKDITFISLLRGLASLLVVWDHLVGAWNDENHRTFLPLAISRQYLTRPLAIIQDFGYLGVATFFFVSGFIITHVGRREGQWAFLIKRFLRIYPPLAVSILLILPIAVFEARATHGEYVFTGYYLGDYLRAFTLFNYFLVPQNPVNGVAWTLAIEVLFYLLCFAMLPLLRAMPVVASGFMTAFCAVVLLRSHDLGDRFFLLADVCGHLPLLLLGQATYLLWARLAKGWQFALLGFANYLVFILALRQVHTSFFPPTNSYGVSTTFAYLLFVIAMMLGPRVPLPRVIGFYSRISYSLYLLHGAVGITLLDLLVWRLGFVASLAVALTVATGCSYLSWRWVEQPSQRLARTLLGSPDRQAPTRAWWTISLVCPVLLVAFWIWLLVPVFTRPPALEAVAGADTVDVPDTLTAPAATEPAIIDTPGMDGTLDTADTSQIAGWIWNAADPQGHPNVAVYVDGQLQGVGPSNHYRDDLFRAGKGDGHHAFLLKSPAILADGGRHQISVKAEGTDKELSQSPLWVPSSAGR